MYYKAKYLNLLYLSVLSTMTFLGNFHVIRCIPVFLLLCSSKRQTLIREDDIQGAYQGSFSVTLSLVYNLNVAFAYSKIVVIVVFYFRCQMSAT